MKNTVLLCGLAAFLTCGCAMMPSGPRQDIAVGVYKPQFFIDADEYIRSDAIAEALDSAAGITASVVGAVDADGLAGLDVLIIPHQGSGRSWDRGGSLGLTDEETKTFLRDWVSRGHGLMTTHDAVGYRRHHPIIPEVALGTGNFYSGREPYSNMVCVDAEHPVTRGMESGEIFTTAYYDYITLQPGESGVVALRGVEEASGKLFSGAPALVAGEFGSGRYVACGMLLGGLAPRGVPEVPKGGELTVLVNSVRYLARARGFNPTGREHETASGQAAFLREVEGYVPLDEQEILPGVSIRKFLEACEIPLVAEWKDSDSVPPALDDLVDGEPVLTDEQFERCMRAETYDRFPESWPRVDLTGLWQFKELPDTEENPENDAGTVNGFWKADFDDSSWTNMPVPSERIRRPEYHAWRPYPFHGVQWYRRTFDAPEAPGKRYVLRFSGIDRDARVWINGQEAGYHSGAGMPFELDITQFVEQGGKNVIAVRNFDAPEFDAPEREVLNGLYDKVELHIRPAVYTRHILLNPVLAESKLELRVELFNSGPEQSMQLKGRSVPYVSALVDIEGERVETSADLGSIELAPGINKLDLEMELDNPVYWSPDNPALYVLTLESADEVLGQARFGFREFTIDGHFFFLNGKRINPVGILLRSAMFMGGTAGGMFPHNPGRVMERRMMGYKNMNFNTLFSSRDWREDCFYDLCDEIGLMIYKQVPGVSYNATREEVMLWARAGREPPADIEVDPASVERLKKFFVERIHNHPSVVMTAVSCEQRSEVYQRSHLAGYEAVKSVDMQNRPVCATSGGAPSRAAFKFSDFEDFHIYPGWIGAHAFDHKQLLINANIDTWRYVEKVVPIVNWEGGAVLPVGRKSEIDKVRELWSQDPPDKRAVIEDIEGRDPAYHMELGARWMSLYGVRRIVFEDYARAERERRALMSYFQRYSIKHSTIAARLVGDLFQGLGVNSGRFFDAFTIAGTPEELEERRQNTYFANVIPRVTDEIIENRIGAANGFNEFRRYSNPVLVCINPSESKNSFAGGIYSNTIYAINDTGDESDNWTIRAAIHDESGEWVYNRTAEIGTVPSMKRKLVPFEWNIPAEAESRTYTLNLYLMEDGRVISDSSFDIHALGTGLFSGKIDAKGRKVALYDVAERAGFPELSAAPVLDDLGFKYERVNTLDNLDKFDVLLIGAASVDGTVWNAGAKITEWLEAGGRMVLFEQEIPGQIPGIPRLSVVKKVGGSVVDMVDLRHPVFKDLQVNDYWSLWNGTLPTAEHYGREGGIYSALIGPLNHTVVGTGVMDVPRATTKAVQMAMADVRVGEGQAFLSQAQAFRRYGRDSVATKYIRNVLEYAVSDITEFSAPLGEFSISTLDFYNFGFVDMGEVAKEKYEPEPEWRKKVQEDGLSDFGDLRFMVESGRAVKIVSGEPVVFNFPDDMKLMFPEREERRVLIDTDQGSLNRQEFEVVFFLLGVSGGVPDNKVGEVVFSYADGTDDTMNLVKGVNIERREAEHPLSGGAYVGNGFYITKWINPNMDKKLVSLSVRATDQNAEILVGGITALLMREKIHD